MLPPDPFPVLRRIAYGGLAARAPSMGPSPLPGNDVEIEQLAGLFKAKLGDCMEKTEDGQLKMTIALPDETFLDNMARSMARMAHSGRK